MRSLKTFSTRLKKKKRDEPRGVVDENLVVYTL